MNWRAATIAAGIVFLLLLSTLVVAATYAPIPGDIIKGYRAHGPIRISSDDDFTKKNGVVGGAGTPEDPFVIEGWQIDSTDGIWIGNTTKNFAIRDIRIYAMSTSWQKGYGIYLRNLTDCEIRDCVITSCVSGILIDEYTHGSSRNITVANVTFTENEFGMTVNYAHNLTVYDCWFSSCVSCGVYARHCDGIEIRDSFFGSFVGYYYQKTIGHISTEYANGLVIRNNTLFGSELPSITCYMSPLAVISDNRIMCYESDAVTVTWCAGATISNNSVKCERRGIYMDSTNGGRIESNRLEDGWMGTHGCTNLVITENVVVNGGNVFLEDTHSSTFSSNVIDGADDTDEFFSSGLFLKESSGIVASDNIITRNSRGALHVSSCSEIDFSENLLAYVSDVSDISGAVECYESANVTLRRNTIHTWSGLYVSTTSGFVLDENYISNGKVTVLQVGDATIKNNTFTGVTKLSFSNDGMESVWGNNIGTVPDVSDNVFAGVWNQSYPTGGNYWANYTGADEFSGPDQDIPGADGIVDLPLFLDEDSADMYPLVAPVEREDNAPPFVIVHIDGSSWMDGWYSVNPWVSIEAFDLQTGVASKEFRLDGGEWQPYVTRFNMSSAGVHSLEARSVDGAGNEGVSPVVLIKYDPYDPEVTNVTPEYGTVIHSRWTSVGFDCHENVSGILYYDFGDYYGTRDRFSEVPHTDYAGLRDGQGHIDLIAVDYAGNGYVNWSYHFDVVLGSDDLFSPDGPYGRWFSVAIWAEILTGIVALVFWGKHRAVLEQQRSRLWNVPRESPEDREIVQEPEVLEAEHREKK